MLIGLVPTGRVREDYRLHIKDKRDYDIAVASGIAWVCYPDLPLSWSEAEKEILAYKAKVEYIEKTREGNYEASR
ncbi:MAG: hypothetical protein ACRC6V_01890 [Bacteroidales bacterium]